MPKPSKIIINQWKAISKQNLEQNKTPELNKTSKFIIKKMIDSSNNEISNLGKEINQLYLEKPDMLSKKLNKLITNLDYISSKGSRLNISPDKYQKLIKKKQNNTISLKENKTLEKALFIKVCNCVKKKLSKSTRDWLLGERDGELDSDQYNPYAICTSSVYNKRGFKRRKSFMECS